MGPAGKIVDKGKSEALLHFVVAIGGKADLMAVDSLVQLAFRHVPMLAATIYTKELQRIGTSAEPLEAYQKAREVLMRFESTLRPSDYLDEKRAADGDEFEICKFLLALLNELRCTYPEAFGGDAFINNRLSDEYQRKIADMLNYLDDPESWDISKSWPAVLMEPFRSFYETPRTGRNRAVFSTGSLNQSPLSEAVSTPIARANRKLREKEKKIKELSETLGAKEIECDDLEKKLSQLEDENKRLCMKVEGYSSKNGDFNKLQMENNHLMEQLQNAERELKDVRSSLTEKRERLSLNEEHISNLQRSYDSVQKEVQLLQAQLKERNETLSRFRADVESADMEIHSLKSRNVVLENNLLQTRQIFEEKLREAESACKLEKDAAREKSMEYEEALATAHARAHELSAKLCFAERQNKEMFRQKMVPVCDQLQELKLFSNILRNDVVTMINYLMQLALESSERRKAIQELQKDYDNLKNSYERLIHSEEHWRSLAHASIADGEILRERSNKMESRLLDLFRIFDGILLNAKDNEEKVRTLEAKVSSLKAESTASRPENMELSDLMPKANYKDNCENVEIIEPEHMDKTSISEVDSEANTSSCTPQVSTSHPLTLADDEGTCLGNTSVCGTKYEITTPAQYLARKYFDGSDSVSVASQSNDSPSSVASGRFVELHERNMKSMPHLRSAAYPEVINNSGIDENNFRNSSKFEPPHRSSAKKTSGFLRIKRNLFQNASVNKKQLLKEANK